MLGKKEVLSAQLAKSLASRISAQEYQPGQRIPTEAKLGAEYGVSRTVVREAVASLRADGLLIARQCVGVFVGTGSKLLPFELNASANGELTDVLQVLELRLSVEVEAAGLAAERHTRRHLSVIKAEGHQQGAARTGWRSRHRGLRIPQRDRSGDWQSVFRKVPELHRSGDYPAVEVGQPEKRSQARLAVPRATAERTHPHRRRHQQPRRGRCA